MFVVLYGVALAMIAGGVYAAFTGWEFLMLERGWSMVIAGATLATGGLLMGGLSAAAQALARRLDALAEAVRASGRAQAPVFPKRPPAAEAAVEPAPSAEPGPRPPERVIEPKIPSRDPASPAGPAPIVALGAAEALASDAARPTAEPAPEAEPEPEPEDGLRSVDLAKAADGSRGDASAPEEAPVTELPLPAEEPQEEPEPGAIGGPGIEQPVNGRRERGRIEVEAVALARRFAEASIPFGAAPRTEPSVEEPPAPEGFADPAADAALERLAAAAAEPPPPREPMPAPDEDEMPPEAEHDEGVEAGESPDEAGVELPEPPVVVGTHVAGANRYVMYSDGSIEADTPDGRLLFASIDELKGYVASAGEDPSGTTQTGPR